MPRTTLFAALACVACLACGGADASKQVETLHSWRATVDLAAEARVKGWVTPRYVKQIRDEAHLAVTAGDKAMSQAKPAARDSLSAAGRDLRASLARLDRAGP